jgi:host factor-I protein
MNIQDSFLNQIRKDGTEVKIALVDGSSLIGMVRGFDNFTVIINSRTSQHLLYKHAIAQVISRRPGRRDDEGGEPRSAAAPAGERAPNSAPQPPRPAAPPAAPPEPKKPDAFNPIDLSGLHTEKTP